MPVKRQTLPPMLMQKMFGSPPYCPRIPPPAFRGDLAACAEQLRLVPPPQPSAPCCHRRSRTKRLPAASL